MKHSKAKPAPRQTSSDRLENAIRDLQGLQQVLLAGELDARVLTDFRDAVNRIRNVAWAAQQLVASQVSENGPAAVTSLLASERIRAAYRLCRAISDDLARDDIQFQKGQLSELHTAILELARLLDAKLDASTHKALSAAK